MKMMPHDLLIRPETLLNGEDQVLLCVAHPQVTPKRRAQLSKLLAAPLNWEQVLTLAERHQITPLLHHHLQTVADDLVPTTIREQIAARRRERLVWNLRLLQELLRILTVCNQAQIPIMPLKGLWLGELLYGDIALRETGDLDLCVRPHDLGLAEQVMKELGYRQGRPREQEEESYHYTFVYDDRRTLPVIVELHWDIVRDHIAHHDMQAVWTTASCGEWHGQEIWTMAPPDLFLILCQNAAKDTFGFLKQLIDIALVVERFGTSWSWPALAHTIQTAHLCTRVYWASALVRQLLGSQIPSAFLDAIRPPPGLSWRIGQSLFRRRGGVLHVSLADVGPPFNPLLALLWEDSSRGKFRHLRRLLFPPASYQARWTGQSSTASWVRWYPLWLWQTLSQGLLFFLRVIAPKPQTQKERRNQK